MTDKTKRMISFDIIRIVSCFAIVYYHFLMSLVSMGVREMDEIRHLYSSRNLHIATVAVGLFFFISGAGLMASSQKNDSGTNLKEYFFKRFKAVLIPFYIAFFLYVITYRIVFGHGTRALLWGNTPTWRIIFTILGIDGYISQYGISTFYAGIGEWFLGAILFSYLLFPVLRMALKKSRWITFFVMTLLYVLGSFFYDSITFLNKVAPYTNALMKLYEFFLGMFFVAGSSEESDSVIRKGLKGSLLHGKYRFIYVLLTAPVLYYYWTYPAYLPYNNRVMAFRGLIQDTAAFLFFAGLEDLLRLFKIKGDLLKRISGLTYFIFLVQHVVINHVPALFPGLVPPASSITLLFALESAIIIALSVILLLLTKTVDHILDKILSLPIKH